MDDPNKEADKGDILWSDTNKNKEDKTGHYMVYLEPCSHDDALFIGVMLTHSKRHGNIPLQKNHFVETDENGNNYELIYDRSLIVANLFLKKLAWAPFRKVGHLTQNGIDFIEKKTAHLAPKFFDDNLD